MQRGAATAAAGQALGEATGLYDENGKGIDVYAVRRGGQEANAAARNALERVNSPTDCNASRLTATLTVRLRRLT